MLRRPSTSSVTMPRLPFAEWLSAHGMAERRANVRRVAALCGQQAAGQECLFVPHRVAGEKKEFNSRDQMCPTRWPENTTPAGQSRVFASQAPFLASSRSHPDLQSFGSVH